VEGLFILGQSKETTDIKRSLMKIVLLRECGYEEAVLGFSLSYNSTIERTQQILPKYAFGIPGESKFLESIQVWLDVTAPRYWWQEADTYRVGTSKQSESTMHTLIRKELTQDQFEDSVPTVYLDYLNDAVRMYKTISTGWKNNYFVRHIKNNLPEGFLQRRIWNLNYKVLQNIIVQRMYHRLPQWGVFCTYLLSNVSHPEFLVKGDTNESVV
jgi:hypothetical protein